MGCAAYGRGRAGSCLYKRGHATPAAPGYHASAEMKVKEL